MNNTNSAAIAVSYNGSDPNDLDLILKSKTDDLALSDLIGNNRNWILQCASKTLKRYITDSDDEWSVSLLAFTEAVRNYDSEKGSFYPFTSVVIRRRLYDYLTSQQKHNNVIFVAPEVFSGESKEVEADRVAFSLQNQVLKAEIKAAEDDTAARAREEIEEMQSILSQYGFSFFDLAGSSPKAAKTKKAVPGRFAH